MFIHGQPRELHSRVGVAIVLVVLSWACFGCVTPGTIEVRNNEVYVYAGWGLPHMEKVPSADPRTFRKLNQNYYKDSQRVYYHTFPVVGADPTTFTARTLLVGSDKDATFAEGELVPGIVKSDGIRELEWRYWTDGVSVFYSFLRLDQSLPESFKVVDGEISKDSSSVYYRASRLAGIDARSFHTIEGEYVVGTAKVYRWDYDMKVAHPEQFHLVLGGEDVPWFTDGEFVYCGWLTMVGVDTDTFVPLPKQWARDKNNVYWNMYRIKDVDIGSFVFDYGIATPKDKFGVINDKTRVFEYSALKPN